MPLGLCLPLLCSRRACYDGHVGMVEFLLDLGLDVHTKDSNGHTPLFWYPPTFHRSLFLLLFFFSTRARLRSCRCFALGMESPDAAMAMVKIARSIPLPLPLTYVLFLNIRFKREVQIRFCSTKSGTRQQACNARALPTMRTCRPCTYHLHRGVSPFSLAIKSAPSFGQ